MMCRFWNSIRVARLALAACALILPLSALAADTLPSAREVVDRHIEAIGGAELFMQRGSMTMTGTFTMAAMGFEGKVKSWGKVPDMHLLEVTIPGVGAIRSGYDGKVAWSVDPMMGAQVLRDESLDQVRESANFYAMLLRPEDVTSITMVGVVNFQGKECYEIAVVSKSGLESRQFYAIDTGLLAGMEQTTHSPMGEVPTVTVFKEYREFEGLLAAVVTEASTMGMQQVMTTDSISFDPIDDAVFALPAEIAALVD